MKVIFHIGVEKTGTTSLQKYFSDNTLNLSSYGIRFISGITIPKFTNSVELVLSCVNDPGQDISKFRTQEFQIFRKRIRKNISHIVEDSRNKGINTLIFSSEHMSSRMRNKEDIILLKELFPNGVDFEIIIYCRRQDELYLGSLAEGIKAGQVITPPFDKKIVLKNGFYSRSYYDYYQLLKLWSLVFGKYNIKLRVYEKSQLEYENVVSDFLFNILDLREKLSWDISMNKNLNKRFSAEFLFSLSMLNSSISTDRRFEILKIADKIDKFKSRTFIPAHRLNSFINEFHDSNRKVAKEYFNRKFLFHNNSANNKELRFASEEHLKVCSPIIIDKIKHELGWKE